jgi:nucleotide-binding universal stress UspA family protein
MPGKIVVGVDGSEPSHEALRWAAAEAELRGAGIVAAHVWTFIPPGPIGEPGMMAMPAGDYAGQMEAEQEAATAELEDALAEVFPDGVPDNVESKLVEGDAEDGLVQEAAGADLLVVGSRGRSGIASVLLGSVSRHVVSHAPCPVVVVKATEEATD